MSRAAAQLVEEVHPVAGAAVMGTGIVSTALFSTGHQGISDVFLGLGLALWVALAAVVVVRLARDPGGVVRGARAAEALTAVAGTCVIGTRVVLGGSDDAGALLLVAGAALWLVLMGPALRALPPRAHGGTLLLCVGTEAVAGLAAGLAAAREASWLLVPAAALAILGLVLYLDVLRRMDLCELVRGHGDHWVLGGALAIAALALANLQQGATTLGVATDLHGALRVVTIAVAVAAALWLPVLVVCEVIRPRLRYDARRWATVFPVGMYAAAASVVGKAEDSALLRDVAGVLVWVAVAVWAVVLAGLLGRVGGLRRRAAAPGPRPG